MMVSVDIKGASRYHVDRKRIREAIADMVEKEGITRDTYVSVSIVGARKMRVLNRDYRDKDYATNVLSFCQQDMGPKGEGFVYPEDDVLYLGDMVICFPVARDQAGERNMFVDEWIEELVRHSMEHLFGHHHS